jgi:hypothetical protein
MPTGHIRTDRSEGAFQGRAEWQKPFLGALRRFGNVRSACSAVQIARSTAHEARAKDSEFAEAWETALEGAAEDLEREAWRRALEGIEEPVYYHGERIGEVRRYSDALLMFLMKGIRPQKYREAASAQQVVDRFQDRS